MSLAQPFAIALLALAIPILIIYSLRGNPQRRLTSAAFLWHGLEEQVTARRKWRRPPLSLALLLQLLVLAVGVAALTQPSFAEVSSRQVVYVLDASASMQAIDIQPSRFEAARQAVRQELTRLRPGERATLIRMGQTPQVIASGSDQIELQRALDAVQPGAASVSLRDALGMAGGRLEAPVGEGSEIVVYSDGSVAEPFGIGPLRVPVRFVKLGQEGANQGVSMLQVRRAPGEAPRFSAFARVTNYAEEPVRTPVRLMADGILLDTRLLDLPARGRAELPFDVPASAKTVAVALGGRDQFALDDRAEVSVPENRRRSVLLVSRSPVAWEQALGAIPGLEVVTQAPGAYRDIGVDLALLDGFIPPDLPGGQIVMVNPPPGNGYVEILGDVRDVQISSFDAQQPLLNSLDLGAMRLVKASRLAVPRWAVSVAETPGGPLILQGDLDGRRAVVLGFDPFISGLEKLIAFPILVSNIVDFLASSGTEPWVAPGRTVSVPIGSAASDATLELPDGSRQVLPATAGAIKIDLVDQVGRYTVRPRVGGEASVRAFHVNLFGESEGDIAPRERASWASATPLEPGGSRPGPVAWLPLAVLGLAVLGLEWLHFLRAG